MNLRDMAIEVVECLDNACPTREERIEYLESWIAETLVDTKKNYTKPEVTSTWRVKGGWHFLAWKHEHSLPVVLDAVGHLTILGVVLDDTARKQLIAALSEVDSMRSTGREGSR